MSGLGNIALWFDEDPQEAKRSVEARPPRAGLAYINLASLAHDDGAG